MRATLIGAGLSFVMLLGSPLTAQQLDQRLLHQTPEGNWFLAGRLSKTVSKVVVEQKTAVRKVPATEVVTENGVERTRTVYLDETFSYDAPRIVSESVLMDVVEPFDPAAVVATEIDGRAIPADALAQRVKPGMLVVMATNDGPLPDYIAAVLKPGTIVFAKPAQERPLGPGGPAIPPGPAAPPVEVPPGLSPRIAFASRAGTDQLKIRQLAVATVPATSMVCERHGDRIVCRPIQLEVEHRHSETATVPLKELNFSRNGSAELSIDVVKQALARGEPTIVISADGFPIAPVWLQNLKPSVLAASGVSLALPSAIPAGMGAPAFGTVVPPAASPAPTLIPPPPGARP